MLHPLLAASAAAASSSSYASPPLRLRRPGGVSVAVRCAPTSDGGAPPVGDDEKLKLKVGSPIVILEAPTMLKTAASVPSLRHNSGIVKAGDVGRIMARKPKDVWAVRLAVGTYLMDGKFFRPLDVVDDDEAPNE